MRAAILMAILSPLLAACSAVPRQEDVTRISTYEIVKQIRCEAKRAIVHADNARYRTDPYYKVASYYKTATIAYEFDFNITEQDNASAAATWGLPYTLGGNFTLAASAGADRTRVTKRNFKITDSFDELRRTDCDPPKPPLPPPNLIYPIAGDIGAYEVVDTFIRLQEVENPNSGQVFTFGDTLMFTTALRGGVTPNIVISPVADRFRLASANADLGAVRNDVHQVTMTLAGDPPKTNKMVGTSLKNMTAGVVAASSQTNSSLVSTTMIQAAVNPTDRALLELDRQRILALQARSLLLVGP